MKTVRKVTVHDGDTTVRWVNEVRWLQMGDVHTPIMRVNT